ncbi:DUF4214 domain-containing protein [Acidimicrobiia bacterium EGI L10123]|uniref:DUF4214 domain-containing protein n=1 Tax=Salinilacustrithrix flava TaxID=2957203 RepID=UPI003D7C2347|nr:DUF4214 domain-containing protein [Acidimicrobiia bacterium EGI L10123]
MKKSLIGLTAAACGAVLLAAPASAAHEDQLRRVYTADLGALNGTGSGGDVTVEVFNQRTAIVTIEAEGMSPDAAPHAQHLHGEFGTVAECPTPAADTDGDGFVSVMEGGPSYGTIKTSLTTEGDTSPQSGLAVTRFPVSQDGTYSYMRVFPVTQDVADNMGNLAVVLHGADLDGSGEYDGEKRSSITDDLPFEATVPVACGELDLQEIIVPAPYGDTDGTEGAVARYYAALLNRAPDTSGFQYWVDTLPQAGAVEVAKAFTQSTEFQARYGPMLDAPSGDLVDFVYTATLGRQADPSGKAYWVDALDRGAITPGWLVAAFSESDEFMALTGTR